MLVSTRILKISLYCQKKLVLTRGRAIHEKDINVLLEAEISLKYTNIHRTVLYEQIASQLSLKLFNHLLCIIKEL